MVMSDSFELDRTAGGRMKINIISAANLIALLALLGTAFATWNGLSNQVVIMGVRVDTIKAEVQQTRGDLNSSLAGRDGDTRDLRNKVDQIGTRLSVVETVMNRMENKIDRKAP